MITIYQWLAVITILMVSYDNYVLMVSCDNYILLVSCDNYILMGSCDDYILMVRFNNGGCTRSFYFEGVAEKRKWPGTHTTYYYSRHQPDRQHPSHQLPPLPAASTVVFETLHLICRE